MWSNWEKHKYQLYIFFNWIYCSYKDKNYSDNKNELTDKKLIFDDPDVYHLDSIVEEALEDSML